MTRNGVSQALWIISAVTSFLGAGMLVTTIFSGETTPIELASMSASAVGVACIPYVFARSFDMIFERQAERESRWKKTEPLSRE